MHATIARDRHETSGAGDDVPRIETADAHRQVRAGRAALVCAYDGEAEYRRLRLEGATPLAAFRSRLAVLSRERPIILYCACPAEATSVREAARLRSHGFTRTMALRGGAEAWRRGGYPMVGAYCAA